MKITDWDEYFMKIALVTAQKSKDPSSQLGAVIVKDRRIISVGYNGFPEGVNDPNDYADELMSTALEKEGFLGTGLADIARRGERPEKYFWFEHAERNAIYNAARVGVSTLDSVIYTNGVPCCDCARGIIQAGLVKVFVLSSWNDQNTDKWIESAKRSQIMFKEAGVEVAELDICCGVELVQHGKLVTT